MPGGGGGGGVGGAVKSLRKETEMLVKKIRMKPLKKTNLGVA